MAKVKIHVTLKDGVLDPQGKTVQIALDKMALAQDQISKE